MKDPRVGETHLGEPIMVQIQGRESLYVAGTIWHWDAARLGYWSRRTSAVQLHVGHLEGRSFLVEEAQELSAMGVVTITAVGSENVYFEKDGVPYFTKSLNTARFVEGEADLAMLELGNATPSPAAAKKRRSENGFGM